MSVTGSGGWVRSALLCRHGVELGWIGVCWRSAAERTDLTVVDFKRGLGIAVVVPAFVVPIGHGKSG
jgi:hypothetical protein